QRLGDVVRLVAVAAQDPVACVLHEVEKAHFGASVVVGPQRGRRVVTGGSMLTRPGWPPSACGSGRGRGRPPRTRGRGRGGTSAPPAPRASRPASAAGARRRTRPRRRPCGRGPCRPSPCPAPGARPP